jgi:hypothetical protein
MSMLEWKMAVFKDTFWEPKKYAISNNRVYIAGIKTPEPIRTTTMSCGSPTLNKPSKPIFGLFL